MPIDWSTLGLSAVIGGGSAYGVFQFVGGKWIDHRFATRLEQSKQELERQIEGSRQAHATDIERLRFRVAGQLDRATKLNQREFEVLPEIWAKLDEAYRYAHDLISPWRTYPDLNSMSQDQLHAFIAGSKLQDWQKGELLELRLTERQRYFSDAISWIELHEAGNAAHEYSSAMTKGAIYLSPEVFNRIRQFGDALLEAVRLYGISKRFRDARTEYDENSPLEKFRTSGQQQYDELATFIRDRFWTAPTV